MGPTVQGGGLRCSGCGGWMLPAPGRWPDRCRGCRYDLQARRKKPAAARRAPCRHCGAAQANRNRGLCWGCWSDPAVRALYPVADCPYTARGLGLEARVRGLPEPTDAPPGSARKLAVLGERAAAGLVLHHPLDARDHAGFAGWPAAVLATRPGAQGRHAGGGKAAYNRAYREAARAAGRCADCRRKAAPGLAYCRRCRGRRRRDNRARYARARA